MGKVKPRSPREWQITAEVDRCQRQTPTLFSSTRGTPPPVRLEHAGGHSGHSGINNNTKRVRKARISLPKVWQDD